MKRLIILVSLILVSCKREKRFVIPEIGFDYKKLQKVDTAFKNKYLNEIPLIKPMASDYEAFFYKKFTVENFEATLVYVVRDAYGLIHMLLFNKKGELVSTSVLSGDICAGPGQLEADGDVYWCNASYSTFMDDNSYFRTIVKKKSKDYNNSPLFIDTIKEYYTILDDGLIKLLKTDSVRVTKRLDEQGMEK